MAVENSDSTITIVGSLASIAGAVIAIWQALRAKKSASKAAELKNQIAKTENTIHVSQIVSDTKKALGESIKLTISPQSKKVSGVDFNSVVNTLRVYSDGLKERVQYLNTDNQNEVNRKIRYLESRYSRISTAANPTNRFTTGEEIHNTIGEIIKIANSELKISDQV